MKCVFAVRFANFEAMPGKKEMQALANWRFPFAFISKLHLQPPCGAYGWQSRARPSSIACHKKVSDLPQI
jgi:hypothetical protein